MTEVAICYGRTETSGVSTQTRRDTPLEKRVGTVGQVHPHVDVNIVGRSKDMVIRGGENVYPREIEEFLYTHPDIADVQVIGVPDERLGEEICAWVIRRPRSSLDEADVRAFCEGRLAHFKVPRYIVFTDAFPMTVTGKVQKFKMREDSVARLGLEDAAAVKSA